MKNIFDDLIPKKLRTKIKTALIDNVTLVFRDQGKKIIDQLEQVKKRGL